MYGSGWSDSVQDRVGLVSGERYRIGLSCLLTNIGSVCKRKKNVRPIRKKMYIESMVFNRKIFNRIHVLSYVMCVKHVTPIPFLSRFNIFSNLDNSFFVLCALLSFGSDQDCIIFFRDGLIYQ